MRTVIRIKDLIVEFFIDYFWGIVYGACLTTGTAAVLKFADTIGNNEHFLETAITKDTMYHMIESFHYIITTYWSVMETANGIILGISIFLLFMKGLFSKKVVRYV